MKPPTLAAVYCHLVPILAEVAREHGYALAVHGTMARDLDLVAVPWIDAASGPTELVGALADRIRFAGPGNEPRGPCTKPHGRLGWTITLDGGAYIDLSVMRPTVREPTDALHTPKPETTP